MIQVMESNLWIGTAGVTVLGMFIWSQTIKKQEKPVPTLGSSSFIGSIPSSLKFVKDIKSMIVEGYLRIGKTHGVYRLPTPIKWLYMVSPKVLIEELKRPESKVLSVTAAHKDILSFEYIFDHQVVPLNYHLSILAGPLNKNMGSTWIERTHTIAAIATEDLVPSGQDNWRTIKFHQASQALLGHVFVKLLVSDPSLYNDDSLIQLMGYNDREMVKAIHGTLPFAPNFLKPLLIPLITNFPAIRKRAERLLFPVILERLRKFEESGPDYMDKEDDILSLFIDAAKPEHRTPYGLTLRLLHFHQASAQTSSGALYSIIGELSLRPEYMEPLQKEIATAISKHGWSKAALSDMVRLESFIMETLRLNPPSYMTGSHKTTENYTLKNGMHIPKGSLVLVPEIAIHIDDEVYPDATKFKGFRFCANTSLEGSEEPTTLTRRLTTIGPDLLAFGIGDHPCPGRFFALTVLKISVAHLIHTYDLKADPTNLYQYKHDTLQRLVDQNFTFLLKPRSTY